MRSPDVELERQEEYQMPVAANITCCSNRTDLKHAPYVFLLAPRECFAK